MLPNYKENTGTSPDLDPRNLYGGEHGALALIRELIREQQTSVHQ